MSATYSGDPTDSDRDELRFLIQDTDMTNVLLTDEELDYLINKWTPLYHSNTFTASVAAGVLARKFAGAVSISADGVSVSMAELSGKFGQMAMQLRADYESEQDVAGEVDISNILWDASFDPSIDPLEFAMRLDDNREAGRQNWGGLLQGAWNHGYSDPLYGRD